MAQEKKQRKPLPIWLFFTVYLAVVAVCIAIDQITKHFVEKAVAANPAHRIKIIGNWLTLVWTTNDGATGGLFSGLSWSNWLFFIMTLIGLPVFGWLLWRSRTRSVWGQVAFSFIIGGTIGNAIDRIAFANDSFFSGEVRDFVQVQGFFGIFNMADSFLVVGVILALLAIIFFDSDSLLRTFLNERKSKQSNVSEQSEQAATDAVTPDAEQPHADEQANPHPDNKEDVSETPDEKN